jgi:hypothetical protein
MRPESAALSLSLRGFYDHRQKHGPVVQIQGDADLFEMDMYLFHKRQAYRLNNNWRWWIQQDVEDISPEQSTEFYELGDRT